MLLSCDDVSESSTSSDAGELSSDDSNEVRPFSTQWYNVNDDPEYSDKSDHSSDDELYNEKSEDEDFTIDPDPSASEIILERDPCEWCKCGECRMINNPGTDLFCCHEIERVASMIDNKQCITLTDDFINLIMNKSVLHLVSYSVNKKGCINEKDTENFNKMLRFTGYKSFLNIIDLKGLGKRRRYGLPACVVHNIREKYPSANKEYTGFKAALDDSEGSGSGNQLGSDTLRAF